MNKVNDRAITISTNSTDFCGAGEVIDYRWDINDDMLTIKDMEEEQIFIHIRDIDSFFDAVSQIMKIRKSLNGK